MLALKGDDSLKQTILIQGQANVDVYYLATCTECTPAPDWLPIPFGDKPERNEWAAAHIAGTGHKVSCAVEIRVDE